MRKIIVAVVFVALTVVSATAQQRKYIVNPRPADTKALPFSDAVLVGNTLFLSGTIGLDPKTGQATGDPEEEAKAVMESMKKTLDNAGFTMEDLVQVQVFCTDLKFYDAFNSVYKTYFKSDFPARAFIGVDKILRNGRYEVMGIAVKKPAQ